MEEEKKTSLSILNQYLFYYFAFNQQALTQMHLKITWISPTYYFGSIDLCYSKTWIIYVVLKDSFVPQWKLWEVSRSCLTLFSLLPPPLTICLEVVNLINFWFILPAWVCVYICMCFPSLFAQKEHFVRILLSHCTFYLAMQPVNHAMSSLKDLFFTAVWYSLGWVYQSSSATLLHLSI